jgi:AcrR family transcriptional regulator
MPDVAEERQAPAGGPAVEGLRERKKRQMRQLISETATEMFLERGFDDVRVTEVADRCGVSEKTVYNYFPTKESLVLDREEDMALAIRAALGPDAPARSPTAAALEVMGKEVDELRPRWSELTSSDGMLERFFGLVESTPSLRAAQRDMMDRLVQVAAEALADRAGVSPDDPEPQIAAACILGLWRIQHQALRSYATGRRDFEEVRDDVSAEVDRAARLIDSGLWAFQVMVQGRGTREQLQTAAETAQKAGRQVAEALRQARNVWKQVQAEYLESRPGYGPPVAGPEGLGWGGHGPYGPGRGIYAPPGLGPDIRQRASGYRRGQQASWREEVEEWKRVQRDLKEQYVKAKREQQKALRDAVRNQRHQMRGRGRGD